MTTTANPYAWVPFPPPKPRRRHDPPPVELVHYVTCANRLGKHIRGRIETLQEIDGTRVRHWVVYNTRTGELIHSDRTRASHYRAITELTEMVGFCRLARWLDIDYAALKGGDR